MKEKVCLVSLGCPKNLVDSEVILGLLAKGGYSFTTDAAQAEILIVNTCSFIEEATKEALEIILHLSRYKKEGRCKRLIVAGCLPQRYGERLEKEMPEVDLFIGTGTFQRLPLMLSRKTRKKSYLTGPSYLYNEKTPRILSTSPFTAYLKIAEGCSKTCTFCTVPKIRGPYRSRSLRSVIEEAKGLAAQGVKELILIAQDTTAYGEDRKDGANLERLLRNLVQVDGLRWIRFLYAYPRPGAFAESLLNLIASEEKICPYIDLPIQHIDDGILRRMGRRSTSQEIRALLQRVRAIIPSVSLRSTVIVGFPGEGEKEFRDLSLFVEETRFDHLGAFKYSAEEGTPASRLLDPVPEEVKQERFATLMGLQQKISFQKYRSLIGKRVEVLVEGPDSQENRLRGRLQTQAPEIDGCVFLKGEAHAGEWVEARVTEALPYDLIGEIERPLP